jgi:hypothetical protein
MPLATRSKITLDIATLPVGGNPGGLNSRRRPAYLRLQGGVRLYRWPENVDVGTRVPDAWRKEVLYIFFQVRGLPLFRHLLALALASNIPHRPCCTRRYSSGHAF